MRRRRGGIIRPEPEEDLVLPPEPPDRIIREDRAFAQPIPETDAEREADLDRLDALSDEDHLRIREDGTVPTRREQRAARAGLVVGCIGAAVLAVALFAALVYGVGYLFALGMLAAGLGAS